MIIAREKKKTNIIEYILYMWQIEDVIRASGFDIDYINSNLVDKFDTNIATKQQIKDWYENLLTMMKNEGAECAGHLQIVKNIVNDVTEHHLYLLYKIKDAKYRYLFDNAVQGLTEIRTKSEYGDNVGDIEIAIIALYGVLMMRLSEKSISTKTENSIHNFSKMLAYLSNSYLAFEKQ